MFCQSSAASTKICDSPIHPHGGKLAAPRPEILQSIKAGTLVNLDMNFGALTLKKRLRAVKTFIHSRVPFESVKTYRFHLVNQAMKRVARRLDGQGVSVL